MSNASGSDGLSQAGPPCHGAHRIVAPGGRLVAVPVGAGSAGPCGADGSLSVQSFLATNRGYLRDSPRAEHGERGADKGGEGGEACSPCLRSANLATS